MFVVLHLLAQHIVMQSPGSIEKAHGGRQLY